MSSFNCVICGNEVSKRQSFAYGTGRACKSHEEAAAAKQVPVKPKTEFDAEKDRIYLANGRMTTALVRVLRKERISQAIENIVDDLRADSSLYAVCSNCGNKAFVLSKVLKSLFEFICYFVSMDDAVESDLVEGVRELGKTLPVQLVIGTVETDRSVIRCSRCESASFVMATDVDQKAYTVGNLLKRGDSMMVKLVFKLLLNSLEDVLQTKMCPDEREIVLKVKRNVKEYLNSKAYMSLQG